ncbi:Helix-turn-helix domain-containing protein [Paraburkholderia fungorum]|uniref:Helix-turn-helix domain-containing protein n=1 Tax=Paraburkholderia fungorum TaxID=134537 RepID=A0A1H1JV11_9BURK|nr:helix-turn-helix domain-containing protein [Paraburkholderia fungorum]SDR53806.1 Helix-turn-helix domain-containing protein [Paraburkholderia fungorum]
MTSLQSPHNLEYSVSESAHVSEHAATFRGWADNKMHQLAKYSPFKGVMRDHQATSNVRFSSERVETPALEQIGQIPLDKVVFAQGVSQEEVLVNGRFVGPDTIYVASGKSLHAVTKSAVLTNWLMVDKDFFFETLTPERSVFSEELPFEFFIRAGESQCFALESAFEEHFESLNSTTSPSTNTQLSGTRILGCANAILMFALESERLRLGSSTRTYIVERSCQLFLENVQNEDFGVLDLCNHLRVSRRTLQYSFETILGLSPIAYMRSVRLNIARRSLLDVSLGKIQEAALDAGFNHLGRFSKYYSDFYGELPSETVNRALNA